MLFCISCMRYLFSSGNSLHIFQDLPWMRIEFRPIKLINYIELLLEIYYPIAHTPCSDNFDALMDLISLFCCSRSVLFHHFYCWCLYAYFLVHFSAQCQHEDSPHFFTFPPCLHLASPSNLCLLQYWILVQPHLCFNLFHFFFFCIKASGRSLKLRLSTAQLRGYTTELGGWASLGIFLSPNHELKHILQSVLEGYII